MRTFLHRIHARLGDFWWYSLMLFCACRAADALNVFVGLWLVPKYVGPAELGAVMPLSRFADFLAIPVAIFASTFRSEITTLALNRRFGQMKTLMRGVFIATVVFLVIALAVCRLVLPAYLERIRIAEGSLGVVILMTSFVGAVAPIFSNALQALKKFRTNSVISLLGAPIRLAAMLATMPFRAISGYFVGQGSTPAFSMIAAVVGLRRELAVPAEPYWTRAIVRRFGKLFLLFGLGSVAAGFAQLVEATVLRQRLPELDSAAYYMVTRFSDIASFLAGALVFTLFPFTAELAARGRDMRPLLLKSILAIVLTNAALAAVFAVLGRTVLSVLPGGGQYAGYWWAIPWLVGIVTLGVIPGLYCTAEVSALRFGYLEWTVPLDLLYAAALLLVTGHGYFVGWLPAGWSDFLARHNITSLPVMLWWITGFNLVKVAGCVIALSDPVRRWRESASLRYLVVGGWNFAFGYGVFALGYALLNGTWPDWAIAAAAAVLGITMSFLTHRALTYRSRGCWWREYLRFYVVYGGQSLANVLLVWLLVTRLGCNAYAVQLVLNLALVVVSYWAHRLYSFRNPVVTP